MRRSVLLMIALLAVPVAAAWAALGDPEVADPQFFIDDTLRGQLQVDAAGRAYLFSQEIVPVGDPNDGDTDRQMVVYERCGTAWQRDARFGAPDDGSFATRPVALEVAPSGDTLAVWIDGDSDERTIYTSFRPAGGDWGATQEVETLAVSHVLADIAPNGDAVLAYVEDMSAPGTVPLQVAVRTKASGVWAKQDLGEVGALWAVAMSPSSEAIALTADRTAQTTRLDSWHKPAGSGFGATRQEAAEIDTTNPLRTAIAFAPDGKAVLGIGVPSLFGILEPEVVTAVRGAGAAGAWSDPDRRSVVDNSTGGIVAIDAVTHPGGVVLGWIERQSSAFQSDLAIARFDGGGFEAPKVYDIDAQFTSLSVAASSSGKAIVAAQHETAAGRNRIVLGEAAGIAGAWPASLDEIPAPAGDHRDPRVAAGGITAVAYGVHGSDQRSDVVASGPSPVCSGSATPTPTATASATPQPTATPSPQPLPPAAPPAATDTKAPRGKLLKVVFSKGRLRLTLRLGEAATVTFRVDGKLLAKRKLRAGVRKLALKPRKKLKRGRHALTVVAVDTAGNRAKTLKQRFRVK